MLTDDILTNRTNPDKPLNLSRLSLRHTSEFRRMKSRTVSNASSIDVLKPEEGNKFHMDKETLEIISIVNKKYRERTQKENSDLYNFLIKTNIKTELKTDLIQADISMEGLYFFFSQFIECKLYKKGDVIYNIEDKCENIYIVLKGEVNLYEIDSSKDSMTGEEYYMYLCEEYKKNIIDTFLLMKIIETNKEKYPVYSINDVNEFETILLHVRLAVYANNNEIDNIKHLYESHHISKEKFNYNKLIQGEITIEKYLLGITDTFNSKHYFYMTILKKEIQTYFNKPEKEITKLNYRLIKTLNKHSYFGNFRLGHLKALREETVKCEQDSLIMSINKKMYSTLIFNEKRLMREKELDLLYQSYFFKAMHKSAFNQRIFLDLDSEEYSKSTTLYSRGDTLNRFYIVKQGTIELSLSNLSLLDLKDIITQLKKKIPRYIYESLPVKENYNLNHPYNTVERSLNTKRKFLICLSEKAIYGDLEYYFNSNAMFNATVTSDKVKLYTFPYTKLTPITNESFALTESLRENCFSKIKTILERLISINNSYYGKINEEYTKKLEEEEALLHGNRVNFAKKDLDVVINKRDNALIHIRNNPSYECYNTNLYEELAHKEMERRKVIRPIIHHKKDAKSNGSQTTSKSNNRITTNSYSSTSILEHKKELTLLLPHINNATIRDSRYQSPIIGKVKRPLMTVQNVPLINKMKHSINYYHNTEENKKKFDFRIISPKTRDKMSVHSVINAYPGGYYLAVQQYLQSMRKKGQS